MPQSRTIRLVFTIVMSGAATLFSCGDDDVAATDAGRDGQVDGASADAADGDGAIKPRDGALDATRSDGSADGGIDPIEVSGDVRQEHQSGTRLRARIAETSLGAEAFLGWYDSELGVDCHFGHAADGSLRCLPDVTHAWFLKIYYADADCKVPLVHLRAPTCGESEFISFSDSNACVSGAVREIYRFGDEVIDKSGVHRLNGDSCDAVGSIGVTLYTLGEAVAPSAFVGGTVQERQSSGGVTRLAFAATDGSEQHWGYRDSTQGFDCNVRALEGGALACVPSEAATVASTFGYYADAQCEEPVGYQYDPGRCRDTAQFSVRTLDGCPSQVAVFANESPERADDAPLYREVRGSCVASEQFASSRFYNTAKLLSGGELQPAELVTGAVRGGIEERLYRFGTDALGRAQWYDRKLGLPCQMDAVAEDGKTRCLPYGEGAQNNGAYFADSSCRQPLVQVTSCHSGLARKETATCPPMRTLYTMAGGHSGDIYRAQGGCSRVLDKSMLTGSFVRLGEKLEASEFVETTVRTE